MIVIVGLGNPGEEYTYTRHNIGWLVLREIMSAYNFPDTHMSSRYAGEVSEGNLFGSPATILLPMNYMNNSGVSVQKFLRDAEDREVTLVVVHDEIDLPFGEIKISKDRGAGGHNGVRSIIEKCGTKDFIRVRLGIRHKGFFGVTKRPTGTKLPQYVLSSFKSSELKAMPDVAKKVATALKLITEDGVEKAMQECN